MPTSNYGSIADLFALGLVVDPDRKRVALTAKKTLVESDLPVIARLEDAQVETETCSCLHHRYRSRSYHEP